MPGYHHAQGIALSPKQIGERVAPCAKKFAWFMLNGYTPHYWQTLFHSAWQGEDESKGLCRYRHLVAGRRGGKTMSAAWELAYYVLHPEEFHWDAHRVRSSRPLHVWVVTKDFPTGHPALTWFRQVLIDADLESGVDYKENKGNHWFEFANGSFVHFRSAEDPESLRGAGNDIIWMDEAAFIPNKRAWEVSRPSLSDKVGQLWTTTTPDGKNWLYKEFWGDKAVASENHARVEYRSIDNPAFPEAEWIELLDSYHPMLFRQEYMASFDSMAGKELHGEWLKYYTADQLPRSETGGLDLDVYIGIDPAISLADDADRWAAAVVGVSKDKTQAFLLEQIALRIPFPEQIEKLEELAVQWKPMFIAVESTAYQLAFAQQSLRIPGFLPIVPMLATGKKHIRILSMAPLFRTGRIRILKTHFDFINEWIDYDSTRSNPEDDCLDAVEIALRMAGAILPGDDSPQPEPDRPAGSIQELARRDYEATFNTDYFGVDEAMGADW